MQLLPKDVKLIILNNLYDYPKTCNALMRTCKIWYHVCQEQKYLIQVTFHEVLTCLSNWIEIDVVLGLLVTCGNSVSICNYSYSSPGISITDDYNIDLKMRMDSYDQDVVNIVATYLNIQKRSNIYIPSYQIIELIFEQRKCKDKINNKVKLILEKLVEIYKNARSSAYVETSIGNSLLHLFVKNINEKLRGVSYNDTIKEITDAYRVNPTYNTLCQVVAILNKRLNTIK